MVTCMHFRVSVCTFLSEETYLRVKVLLDDVSISEETYLRVKVLLDDISISEETYLRVKVLLDDVQDLHTPLISVFY